MTSHSTPFRASARECISAAVAAYMHVLYHQVGGGMQVRAHDDFAHAGAPAGLHDACRRVRVHHVYTELMGPQPREGIWAR